MKIEANKTYLVWELPLLAVVLFALLLTGNEILLIWALVLAWFTGGDIRFVPRGAPEEPREEEE
jgi:hypothetical protein